MPPHEYNHKTTPLGETTSALTVAVVRFSPVSKQSLVRVNSTTDASFLFVSLIEVFIRPANSPTLDVIVKVELLEVDCITVSENCNNKLTDAPSGAGLLNVPAKRATRLTACPLILQAS
jgi:hypothetical protein